MSIDDCFRQLVNRLQPKAASRNALQHQAAEVRGQVIGSLSLLDVLPVGSYANGTAIAGDSHWDLLAVFLPQDLGEQPRSQRAAEMLLSCVQQRYLDCRLTAEGHVVVPDVAGSVDLLPALPVGQRSWQGHSAAAFAVGDGHGGWRVCAPGLHAAFLAQAQAASNGMLIECLQVIKYWRALGTPRCAVRSYYLEHFFSDCKTFQRDAADQDLLWDAYGALFFMALPPIHDVVLDMPVQAVDDVAHAKTLGEIDQALEVMCRCVKNDRSTNNPREAWRYWNQKIFSGHFPELLPD